MDGEQYARTVALAATWVYSVILKAPELLTAPAVPRSEPADTPWRNYAEQQIYGRLKSGLPHDLADVPREYRRSLPDTVLYGPFGTLLTRLDGKKSLAEAVRETEGIRNVTLTRRQSQRIRQALNYLSEWGMWNRSGELYTVPVRQGRLQQPVWRKEFASDSCLCLEMRILENGAETGQAIRDVIGSGDAFTTFTQPYIMIGGV